MKDRLAEVKQENDSDLKLESDAGNDFFNQVEAIQEDIVGIKEVTRAICRGAKLGELKALVRKGNCRAQCTKGNLEILHKVTEGSKLSESDARIRKNLFWTLTRQFGIEVQAYQRAQQDCRQSLKQTATRQVRIVNPNATEEEINRVMQNGVEDFYRKAILNGRKGVNQEILHSYNKTRGFYDDIKTLEQSLAELLQLFVDLSFLTNEQGEVLDSIEYQMRSTNDYVELGNEELAASTETQRKTRRKRHRLLSIVAAVGVIVALILL